MPNLQKLLCNFVKKLKKEDRGKNNTENFSDNNAKTIN